MLNICDYLISNKINFEENVSLSKKTWLRTGGLCQYWISPDSIRELIDICQFLYKNGHVFEVIGQTSNMFFHNTYTTKIVISTISAKNYSIDGDVITVDCGVPVVKLAKEMLEQGYAGFYGLTGLPGTVASAIVNNASCF